MNHDLQSVPPIRLFLDSNSCDFSFGNGDVQFNLQHPIDVPRGYYMTVALAEFTLPICQFNVTELNNKFELNNVGAVPGAKVVVSVTPGNYNIDSLLSFINASLAAAPCDVTLSYNDTYGKISLYSPTNSFSLFGSNISTINTILGFTSASQYDSNNNTITSDTFPDLTGNNGLYITTQMLCGNYSWIKGPKNYSNGRGSNVLAKLQVNGLNGDVLFFDAGIQCFQNRVTDKTVSFIRMTLLDETGAIYTQANLGFSATLDFRFYKLQEDFVVEKQR